ncbi:MAG: SurA N-terminal domain-containing protein [Burkholderiales bacterium]|uniref:SurA N-terminal domain-containing protein n=1 Tax=Nitrosomonas sp. TaxID=42353 RepID=UPI001D7DEBEC|nr:SurA N-terminal domain-containing protein [Nitrosomonas sp.]MCB1947955.1 SurA N-terminal domain-containing protein [Nitrosomonas sp.]MCP5242970.1 SurA N-terminal domain-containing protein [Burkholderiales bacterium]
MFNFVNRKKRIVQIVLLLAVLPFMFWGVQSYRSDGQEGYVAIVDGEEIPRREFEQALRDHQARLRAMFGGNFDSAMLDSYEVRDSVLERLIQQRLLFREAISNGFTVLDSQLVNEISQIPEFHLDNKFSKKQYESFLRNEGLSPVTFESRVRQELLLRQLLDGYSENGFVSDAVANKVIYLSEVQREISQAQIKPEDYMSQIEPAEDEIKAYYDEHQSEFFLPERVRVAYLVLSLKSLAENEPVSDEAVQTYYDEHQIEFGQPEERRASHILIAAAATTEEGEKQLAREKAENILEQVLQDPERFAELAEEYSDDPGSSSRGGDLGFFGRGVMVKAFEDEIFQMQPDEIRGLVETDFGFHIIQLTEVKEAKTADLADVKEQIEEKLKLQMASDIFGEAAEDFSNTVYEQSDSLSPAAEKFELKIQETDWINRNSNEPSVLADPSMMNAIFSDEAIVDKRNTEAIEVMPDTLVSARVLEHRQATAQSLSVVHDEIVERLKQQLAEKRAVAEGRALLADLQDGTEDTVDWGEPKQVSYMQPSGLSQEVLRAVFQADVDSLPAYTGVENAQGGFSLIRISQVINPETLDQEKRKNFAEQLQQMKTQEEISAYLDGIRSRYDVTIRRDSY